MALTDNLEFYLKMDETGTGTRVDATPNALDFTNVNSVTDGVGKINNGSAFTGASSMRLTRADSAAISPTAAFSISTWVKPTTLGDDQTIAAKWPSSSDCGWTFQTISSGKIRCFFAASSGDGGGNFEDTTSVVLSTSAFVHCAFVYDGSLAAGSRMKIYADGTLQTVSISGTINSVAQDTSGAFWIGAIEWLGRYWTGVIDEFGFWSRALGASEVTSLYNGGAGLAYPFNTGAALPFRRLAYMPYHAPGVPRERRSGVGRPSMTATRTFRRRCGDYIYKPERELVGV